VNRSTAGRLGGLTSWANTPDRAARASAGYSGLLARFEREARANLGDQASEKDVAAAAESLKTAHYVRLAANRLARKAS
jgi:hypothetical protein